MLKDVGLPPSICPKFQLWGKKNNIYVGKGSFLGILNLLVGAILVAGQAGSWNPVQAVSNQDLAARGRISSKPMC